MTQLTAPARGPLADAQTLADELDHLEIEVYRTLHVVDAAREVSRQAAAAGLDRLRIRADLLVADILSRTGQVEEAWGVQRRLRAEAQAARDPALVRRACIYLASTYNRLGRSRESMTCVQEALRPPDEGAEPDPPAWRAEALMVLAMFSMTRPGADVQIVTRAHEAVVRHGGPCLVAATEANFAEVAAGIGRLDLAREMTDAALETLRRNPDAEAVTTWDSIALGLAATGDLPGAQRAIERALAIEPLLGLGDVSGDPWLTAAQICLDNGQPEYGLRALDSPRRPALSSAYTRTRDLRVRARLLAAVRQWREAYEAMTEHQEAYEQVRNLEADRLTDGIQSRVTAVEERARAEEFERLALTDSLTGLPNRRAVDQWLDDVVLDHGTAVALAIVDADHFKQVNDGWSHDVGDQVLHRLGGCLSSVGAQLGQPGLTGRLGGEEFLMVWPAASESIAVEDAERVRARMAELSMSDLTPGRDAVTVSIGVTLVRDAAELRGSPRPALARADAALYVAKRSGRNAVRPG